MNNVCHVSAALLKPINTGLKKQIGKEKNTLRQTHLSLTLYFAMEFLIEHKEYCMY